MPAYLQECAPQHQWLPGPQGTQTGCPHPPGGALHSTAPHPQCPDPGQQPQGSANIQMELNLNFYVFFNQGCKDKICLSQ